MSGWLLKIYENLYLNDVSTIVTIVMTIFASRYYYINLIVKSRSCIVDLTTLLYSLISNTVNKEMFFFAKEIFTIRISVKISKIFSTETFTNEIGNCWK